MNKEDLINQIESIKNARRVYRDNAAKFVLENPELFPFLLELVFENKIKTAIKASWVLELVCMEQIKLMALHLNYFTERLKKLDHESILRPLSKICFFITNTYCSSNSNQINKNLTMQNKTQMIEVNFDWLIENRKVATQVFAMDTLYFLGLEFDWVHQELKLILEQNLSKGSPGYQVRAKRTLKKLAL